MEDPLFKTLFAVPGQLAQMASSCASVPEVWPSSRRTIDDLHGGAVLVAMGRNEERTVAEFVLHHLFLGFRHVLIFDDRSTSPLADVLKRQLPRSAWPKTSVMRLCSDPVAPSVHVRLMNQGRPGYPRKTPMDVVKAEAVEVSLRAFTALNASWAVHLDVDEFLQLRHHGHVESWLASMDMAVLAICVQWLNFGSSFLEFPPEDTLLTKAFVWRSYGLDATCKSAIRLNRMFNWVSVSPHHFALGRSTDTSRWAGNVTDPWSLKSPMTVNANGGALGMHCEIGTTQSGHCKGKMGLGGIYNRKWVGMPPQQVAAVLVHYKVQGRYGCAARRLLPVSRRPTSLLGRNDSFAKWDDICGHGLFNEVLDTERMLTSSNRIFWALKNRSRFD